MQGIGIVYSDELNLEYFNQLCALVTDLYQDATRQLAAEIRPPAQPPAKKPRKRTPSTAGARPKKMISVRGKGKLIGELRPADSEWHKEVIEVRSDYDKHLLSTYLQHGDEWVEIKPGSLQEQITQNTSILQSAQQIIMTALEDYVRTQDFVALQNMIQTSFSIMAGTIEANFTETASRISTLNGETR